MSPKNDQTISDRDAPAHQIIQFVRSLFFINKHVFHHLKLDIVLAIPDSNEQTIQQHMGE